MPYPFVFEELRRKKTKADIVKSAPEARRALTGDSCTRRDSVDADMVRKRGRNRHNWATSAKTLPGARVLSCPRRCETLAWYNAKKPGDLGVFQAVCFKPKLEEVSAGHQTRHS